MLSCPPRIVACSGAIQIEPFCVVLHILARPLIAPALKELHFVLADAQRPTTRHDGIGHQRKHGENNDQWQADAHQDCADPSASSA